MLTQSKHGKCSKTYQYNSCYQEYIMYSYYYQLYSMFLFIFWFRCTCALYHCYRIRCTSLAIIYNTCTTSQMLWFVMLLANYCWLLFCMYMCISHHCSSFSIFFFSPQKGLNYMRRRNLRTRRKRLHLKELYQHIYWTGSNHWARRTCTLFIIIGKDSLGLKSSVTLSNRKEKRKL